MAYCAIVMSSGELYHHGILGQKWGHRNGPPYPLSAGDHSAREKKAGWKSSLKKAGNYAVDKQKKYAVIKKDKETARKESWDRYKKDRKENLEERSKIKKDLKDNRRRGLEIVNRHEEESRASSEKQAKAMRDLRREAFRDAKNGASSLKEKLNDPDFKAKVAKTAKIGAAVAAAGLAAYGAYKLHGAIMTERNRMSPYALKKAGIAVAKVGRWRSDIPNGVAGYGKTTFYGGKVQYEVQMEDGRRYVKTFFNDLTPNSNSAEATAYQDSDVWKALFGYDPTKI